MYEFGYTEMIIVIAFCGLIVILFFSSGLIDFFSKLIKTTATSSAEIEAPEVKLSKKIEKKIEKETAPVQKAHRSGKNIIAEMETPPVQTTHISGKNIIAYDTTDILAAGTSGAIVGGVFVHATQPHVKEEVKEQTKPDYNASKTLNNDENNYVQPGPIKSVLPTYGKIALPFVLSAQMINNGTSHIANDFNIYNTDSISYNSDNIAYISDVHNSDSIPSNLDITQGSYEDVDNLYPLTTVIKETPTSFNPEEVVGNCPKLS
jgi:hypothetical protein